VIAHHTHLGLTIMSLLVALVLALGITPVVRNFARRRGWVDRPDGRRKLHPHPIPRLGGVAVFVAFAFTCALLLAAQRWGLVATTISPSAYLDLLVGCTAVLLLGVMDDIRGVSPGAKILIQALAGLYLFFNGYQITAISNPITGNFIELGWASLPLTLVWFVGMSNAFNLIDGLDGLAAGIGLFSTTTLFIACTINERWEIAVIAAALGGALLGFLRYNFNPASVFLGDAGSLFVGFALAAIAIRGSMKSSAAVAIAAPLMALAVPLLDAAVSVIRRLIRGDDVFRADGDHIHHRLLRKGLTPRRAVAILYCVAAAFGALSLLMITGRGQVVGLVVIATSVVTWIGVQQLGYAEFAEIQRTLRHGLGNERRSMGNNVFLAMLVHQFAEATDAEQLRKTLHDAMTRLQFASVEVLPANAESANVATLFPAWRSQEVPAGTVPTSTWSVPLVRDGRAVAVVVLTRSLTEQTQFDPAYLLSAIQNGFGVRALSLALPIKSAPLTLVGEGPLVGITGRD